MSWIPLEEKYPPEGLRVLLEVSGYFTERWGVMADHSYYIGVWIIPDGETEGHWLIYDSHEDGGGHLADPEVHAWMPLPKHYQPQKYFTQEEDLMEHSLFEEDPEWLYKDDCVYEQMSLEDFMKEDSNVRN